MALQKAKITQMIDGNNVEVEMRVAPQGGHGNGGGHCGACQATSIVKMRARNDVGAAVGDTVNVEDRAMMALLTVLIVLLFPIVTAVIGYSLWGAVGLLLAAAGILIDWVFVRTTKERRTARVVSYNA